MRLEKDSMGEMEVPDEALFGASTQRAVLNFPISGRPMPTAFVHALGTVKWACAAANKALDGSLPASLIKAAALEVEDGQGMTQIFLSTSFRPVQYFLEYEHKRGCFKSCSPIFRESYRS